MASLLLFAVAVGGIAGAGIAQPPEADASGTLVTPAGGAIRLDSEAAIVSWVEGQERIDLRLGVDSLAPDTGLIIPTPTAATVSLGTMADFSTIADEMTPRYNKHDHWWEWPDEQEGTAANEGVAGAPTISDQIQLGPLDAATFAAADTAGLTAWMDERTYTLSSETAEIMAHYAEMGWSFVAIKLTGEAALDGEISPIRLQFASDRMFYPVLLSSAAASPLALTLYVLSDHRQEAITFTDGAAVPQSVLWAQDVRNPALQQRGTVLTTLAFDFTKPATDITDDLRFEAAPTDEEVGTAVDVHEYITLVGTPVGWLIVGFAAVIMGIVLALSLIPKPRSRGHARH